MNRYHLINAHTGQVVLEINRLTIVAVIAFLVGAVLF